MFRREITIALRAPIVWLQAALSALLVGHGFVLAVDLYSAGSRSAMSSRLEAQAFDPLLGIVRPTLGGLYLALSLLGPIVAARAISVEKERRTWEAHLLHARSTASVLASKWAGAFTGIALQFIAPIALVALWKLAGGHLAAAETGTAVAAYLLYAAVIGSIAFAASAWAATLAQATTVAVLVVAASWAIDASEGFAALAWLGRALDWSVTTHLAPLERGTFSAGAALWMLVVSAGTVAFGWVGVRTDWNPAWRAVAGLAVLAATVGAGAGAHAWRRSFDLTEASRESLPPAIEAGLRTLRGPISMEVWLDRDDARRHELESAVVSKYRLARPDFEETTPTDDRARPGEADRDPSYGRIVVSSGGNTKETSSAGLRELTTLIFEAQGRPLPAWDQADYPGFPCVVEGTRRALLVGIAYAGIPSALLVAGAFVTRSRRSPR